MFRFLRTLWRRDAGVLSFEWILLITLLVIGIVGGLSAARDAFVDELGDVAEAVIKIDQSYDAPGYGSFEDTGTDATADPVACRRDRKPAP